MQLNIVKNLHLQWDSNTLTMILKIQSQNRLRKAGGRQKSLRILEKSKILTVGHSNWLTCMSILTSKRTHNKWIF